eukprot:m.91622 g.91622  ORF g.91622 m.91622 type:complete len:216 (-) comp26488_c1_seq1:184-831(-)
MSTMLAIGVLCSLFVGASCLENCVIAADGTHEAVDLNGLYKSGSDYSVTSNTNPQYRYTFNICGQTYFRDTTCSEGSTVCELKDGSAVDVYGFIDTIGLQWQSDALVLSMTGEAECPFNSLRPYRSSIYFYCSTETTVALRSESYYQCNLEFEFHTPVACGGTAVHYSCVNDECVPDVNGPFASRDDCTATCIGPPPPPSPPPLPLPPPLNTTTA